MSFVVDASIALAWCFSDEQTDGLQTLLDRLISDGGLAPQLWALEALNGLLIAERRGRIDAPTRRRFAAYLSDLPIQIDDETAARSWTAVAAVAERHGLSAYDAAYLELAMRTSLPLATLDGALLVAATAERVELLATG